LYDGRGRDGADSGKVMIAIKAVLAAEEALGP
jgi:hypothetical protein